MSVFSPISLMAFLLADTVPSDPMPQKMHWRVPGGQVSGSGPHTSERKVTSSSMPTEKLFLGTGACALSKTAAAMPGVNSREPSPKRPPRILMWLAVPTSEVATSMYSGSPTPPDSLVRSSTVMVFTVRGSVSRNALASHGRNSFVCTIPYFFPAPSVDCRYSSTTQAPEPIATTTCSACGWPL